MGLQYNSVTPDATPSIKGKVRLAGDLGGTATSPTVTFSNDTLHVLKAGDTMTGTLNITSGGITQSGGAGDIILNNGGGSEDIKLYGNSLPMVYVRKFFDRIGFGINGTTDSVDHDFDVNLDSYFRKGVNIRGTQGLGNNSSVDPNKVFNVDQFVTTTTSDVYGFNVIIRENPVGNNSNTVFGGFIDAQTTSGNSANLGQLRGIKVYAEHNGSGTIDEATAAEFQTYITGSGTITQARGVNINSSSHGSGNIGTIMALNIEDQTEGVTNYAIKTGLGIVSFGDVLFPVQASTVSAPSYVKGGMYFDTTLNKLRIGGATGWETVTSI